jgi:hypothetical protein
VAKLQEYETVPFSSLSSPLKFGLKTLMSNEAQIAANCLLAASPALASLPVRHSLGGGGCALCASVARRHFFAQSKPNFEPQLTHIKSTT